MKIQSRFSSSKTMLKMAEKRWRGGYKIASRRLSKISLLLPRHRSICSAPSRIAKTTTQLCLRQKTCCTRRTGQRARRKNGPSATKLWLLSPRASHRASMRAQVTSRVLYLSATALAAPTIQTRSPSTLASSSTVVLIDNRPIAKSHSLTSPKSRRDEARWFPCSKSASFHSTLLQKQRRRRDPATLAQPVAARKLTLESAKREQTYRHICRGRAMKSFRTFTSMRFLLRLKKCSV
mmetsp:Transcript_33828/g.41822  ORF Transcript_33828/g.41822 Transcript_33828/m.41822 type:complete len:236 (-) Transcript_33828:159-866(-)